MTNQSTQQRNIEAAPSRELRDWEKRDDIRRNFDPAYDAEMEELDRRHDALGQAAYRMAQARKKQRGW
ncbi:MAG: hypothetical protein RL223_548 [Pseudomonadota bacterium]|jgi:uncharacterized protein YeaO (DUF488 family)